MGFLVHKSVCQQSTLIPCVQNINVLAFISLYFNSNLHLLFKGTGYVLDEKSRERSLIFLAYKY